MPPLPEPAVRHAVPGEADALSAIAQAAKRSWGYPESWLAAWRTELTLTPEFVVTHAVYVAVEGDEIVGFHTGQGARRVGGVKADMEGHPRVLPCLLLDLEEPV
jgi:hypothetical protein